MGIPTDKSFVSMYIDQMSRKNFLSGCEVLIKFYGRLLTCEAELAYTMCLDLNLKVAEIQGCDILLF